MRSKTIVGLALIVAGLALSACAHRVVMQEVDPVSDMFIGVCYGPFRAGQAPGGAQPSDAEILEDLRIIERHFPIIRVYSSMESTPRILELIDGYAIELRVIVGAWLACEHAEDLEHITPEVAQANRARNVQETLRAAELAERYPGIVAAVCLGNESQVSWSAHKLRREALLRYIGLAKERTSAPVTVADDFTVWSQDDSRALADELDFLIVHIYAAWHGRQLEEAVEYTDAKLREVRAVHPDKQLVVGELGWPTSVATSGEQAELIRGEVGQAEQLEFTEDILRWSRRNGVPLFLFEAFDEPWKGGDDPAEVEKHWGVFDVERMPKAAANALPNRVPEAAR